MSLRKLQREWYARAAASGFVDLEGPSGTLSDRGNLHPVAETQEEHTRLAQRMEDGAAYTEWADSVLHNTRFRSRAEREAWRLQAEGMPQRDIAPTLTIARRSVRRHLARVEDRVSKVSRQKRWVDQKKQRVAQVRALVTRCDPRILAKLAAVMLQQARNSQSGSSTGTSKP